VDRCLRIDVLERDHLLVLVFDLGRKLAGYDAAKDTIGHGASRSLLL
jgi:hypothetical protein